MWHSLKQGRASITLKFHRETKEGILSSFKLSLYIINMSHSQQQQAHLSRNSSFTMKSSQEKTKRTWSKNPRRVSLFKACFEEEVSLQEWYLLQVFVVYFVKSTNSIVSWNLRFFKFVCLSIYIIIVFICRFMSEYGGLTSWLRGNFNVAERPNIKR